MLKKKQQMLSKQNEVPVTAFNARFSKKSFDFIAKASRQTKPEWLDKNRQEYEDVLVAPMRDLMISVGKALQTRAPGYRFPNRGFARIRRNADRAKAQGWYKDWIGVSVSRDSGSMYEDLPALYFHLSEKDVFSAGGLYMPNARQLRQIRAWVDQDPSQVEKLLQEPKFKKHFKALGDERVLKTKPRNYPADHPRMSWLKLTGWYVWRPVSRKELFSKEFAEILVADWEQVLRFNRVLDHYTSSWPKTSKLDDVEIQAPQVNWDED